MISSGIFSPDARSMICVGSSFRLYANKRISNCSDAAYLCTPQSGSDTSEYVSISIASVSMLLSLRSFLYSADPRSCCFHIAGLHLSFDGAVCVIRDIFFYAVKLFHQFFHESTSPLCIRAVYATALPMICCFVSMRGNRPPHPLPRIHPSHWLWNREALRLLTSVHFQVRQQCPCCRCCCKHKM